MLINPATGQYDQVNTLSIASEQGSYPLAFQGANLVLLQDGALWHPEGKLLVVSDLHFGKGSFYGTAGQLLPPYDTSATLDIVEQLMTRLQPQSCISLGDSFHDMSADERLSPNAVDRIKALTNSCDWIWVEGNHDPAPPVHFGGRTTDVERIGTLIFRHEPTGETGEVAGHLHPVAKVKAAGRQVRRKSFVTDENSLILPSLGAYTGGLNVRDAAFSTIDQKQLRTFIIGNNRVYEIARNRLVADRRRV